MGTGGDASTVVIEPIAKATPIAMAFKLCFLVFMVSNGVENFPLKSVEKFPVML